MKKMQEVLDKITQLTKKEADLVELLVLDNPTTLQIGLSNTHQSRGYEVRGDSIKNILPFIEAHLEEIRSKLIPLKERIKSLEELLDKSN